MRYIHILITLFCCLAFTSGYMFKTIEKPIGECIQPEHEGDITISKLVMKESILTMECERHSTMKETPSSNRGEIK